MTVDEIRELIQLAAETGVAELEVQRGDNRVRIRQKFSFGNQRHHAPARGFSHAHRYAGADARRPSRPL